MRLLPVPVSRPCAALSCSPLAFRHRLKFDVRLLQRVPYEGVSRMQTSLRRRHRDRIVRRGIGMVIESDVRRNTATPLLFAFAADPFSPLATVLRNGRGPCALLGSADGARFTYPTLLCAMRPLLTALPRARSPSGTASRRRATSCAAATLQHANSGILLTSSSPQFPQDALYAYLTCSNYDFRYDLQKGEDVAHCDPQAFLLARH